MPEHQKSISDARQGLTTLSENASRQLDRYIITNQGQPQSVLLGYDDYQSLKTATQILQQPGVVEDIRTGLKELEEGRGLSLDEVAAKVRDASRERGTGFTSAIAENAGVDSKTVAAVLRSFASVAMERQGRKSFKVPGLGVVTVQKAPVRARSPKTASRGRVSRSLVVDLSPAE